MPSFKIGTSSRVYKEDTNPGPGSHELLDSSFHNRHKSPRATIG